MGMYTGIRFKGFVKEEYREAMKDIALQGNWGESEVKEFRSFGEVSRSHFVPCGGLSYMPGSWEIRSPNDVDKDEFDRTYDPNTGYWTFQCSLKNYDDTIEEFFKLIPMFIERIEHLEYFYEEWDYSWRYELIDGEVVFTEAEFIKYY